MGSKIEFVSFIEGLESIEECRPKSAKHFIPQWFKDIPSSKPSTVKICPSFPDYFSMGYVLPMWTDIRLHFDKNTEEWRWNTPSNIFAADVHENTQFMNYVTPNYQGINGQFVFKMICPWRIFTPPGWSVLQLPLFYNFNKEFSTLPGIVDTDIHHQINQQILYHGDGKEIEIKRGTPLALYVPFKRESIYLDLDIRFSTEKDIKKENTSFLNFRTMFAPGVYRKMQRDRDKNL